MDILSKPFQTYINDELLIKGVHTTVGDKLDKKLITLTQLHFEITEISKTVNQMFSFQMLVLMAYGFMAITARIYFVYTGLAGQVYLKLLYSFFNLVLLVNPSRVSISSKCASIDNLHCLHWC